MAVAFERTGEGPGDFWGPVQSDSPETHQGLQPAHCPEAGWVQATGLGAWVSCVELVSPDLHVGLRARDGRPGEATPCALRLQRGWAPLSFWRPQRPVCLRETESELSPPQRRASRCGREVSEPSPPPLPPPPPAPLPPLGWWGSVKWLVAKNHTVDSDRVSSYSRSREPPDSPHSGGCAARMPWPGWACPASRGLEMRKVTVGGPLGSWAAWALWSRGQNADVAPGLPCGPKKASFSGVAVTPSHQEWCTPVVCPLV